MTAIVGSDLSRLLARRQRGRARFDHGSPIQGFDTLPILLFLFGLVATFLALFTRPHHALIIDLRPTVAFEADPEARFWRIGMDADGSPRINGERIPLRDFARILAQARALPRQPSVVFEPAARARFGDVLPLLGAIHKAELTYARFCFGALEEYRRFDKDAVFKPLRLTLLDPIPMPVGTHYPTDPKDCGPQP